MLESMLEGTPTLLEGTPTPEVLEGTPTPGLHEGAMLEGTPTRRSPRPGSGRDRE